jgi:hypothetical protein
VLYLVLIPYDGGAIGAFIGDAIRNFVSGDFEYFRESNAPNTEGLVNTGMKSGTSVFVAGNGEALGFSQIRATINASRVVPTANENRSASLSVLYCISY